MGSPLVSALFFLGGCLVMSGMLLDIFSKMPLGTIERRIKASWLTARKGTAIEVVLGSLQQVIKLVEENAMQGVFSNYEALLETVESLKTLKESGKHEYVTKTIAKHLFYDEPVFNKWAKILAAIVFVTGALAMLLPLTFAFIQMSS